MQSPGRPPQAIYELLDTQAQCVLSTTNKGRPSQHLMAYAFNASLEDILVVSMPTTEKSRNMLGNRHVALLWDNRTGNTADHRHGMALSAQGTAELLQGWMRAGAMHLLRARNPEIEPLLGEVSSMVFRIRVDNYRLANGYGKVSTWNPTPTLAEDAA